MSAHPRTRREVLWRDWETLTAALRSLVGTIPAAWMSGSFVSDKVNPGDIDCLYVVDTEDVQSVVNAGGPDASLLMAMVSGPQVRGRLGLNVDSYLLEWCPTPGPRRDAPPDYYESRGYWDDFWARRRDTDPRLDAIPRRGYLEVIIDGYQ